MNSGGGTIPVPVKKADFRGNVLDFCSHDIKFYIDLFFKSILEDPSKITLLLR